MDELDGVIAAPDHHKVIFENEVVRVLEIRIAVGDTAPLHTHLRPTTLYVVSGSHFIRRDEHGAVLLDTRSDPSFVLPRVIYQPTQPRHTLQNTGTDDIVMIGTELKEPAGTSGGDPPTR
jgi:quercetin dioxygenase-like cupin family protein